MTSDERLVRTLASRYAQAVESLENAPNHAAVQNARAALSDVRTQAQALWDAIVGGGLTYEGHQRRADAVDSGLSTVLSQLRSLDLDSLLMFLPNTETFEQRGVSA